MNSGKRGAPRTSFGECSPRQPGKRPWPMRSIPGRRYRFDAIRLDLAIAAGDQQAIPGLLAALDPRGSEQAIHSLGVRGRALAAIGNLVGSAPMLMGLADAATDPAAADQLSTAIWQHLTPLPVMELRDRAKSASTPSARAWWMLASEFNAAVTRRSQVRLWQRWRSRHPDHPAARHPPPPFRQSSLDPSQLALLVPVTGAFGPAGKAVRDGFLAAYLHAGGGTQRVQIYDTNSMSVRAAYDQARQQGAEVIIGPLQKDAVAALAALSPTVPVIALNHLDPGTPTADAMVQFSLAIEDQASAIAEALSAHGIERIVIFDSPARWSARARARLEDELDGVEAVGSGTFHRLAQITNIVGDALHVGESQTRMHEIESLLGRTLEFSPRRRDDVDAVVALIDTDQFLSLKPALDFHFAGDLPVFAPTTATLGSVDMARLEGLRICTMPWTLDPGALGKAVAAAFPASRGSYASLFALGRRRVPARQPTGPFDGSPRSHPRQHRRPVAPGGRSHPTVAGLGRSDRRPSRAPRRRRQLTAHRRDRLLPSLLPMIERRGISHLRRALASLTPYGRADTATIGRRAERRAERLLRRHGLRTLARNYARRCGEIDLAMLDGDVLVFVEVRCRSARAWTSGLDSVDADKRRRIVRTAERYLEEHPQHRYRGTRFDVVSVTRGNYRLACAWIRDAFDAMDG